MSLAPTPCLSAKDRQTSRAENSLPTLHSHLVVAIALILREIPTHESRRKQIITLEGIKRLSLGRRLVKLSLAVTQLTINSTLTNVVDGKTWVLGREFESHHPLK